MTARNQQMMILDTVLMDNDFHSHPSSLHRHQTKMGTMTTMRITPIIRIQRLLVSRSIFLFHSQCSLRQRKRIQIRSNLVRGQTKTFTQTTQKRKRMRRRRIQLRSMEMTPITRIRRLLVSRKIFPCHHGHCSLHRRRRIQLRSTIVSVQVKEFRRTTQKQMRMMGDHALSLQIQ
jgi:hypothetical protein